MKGGEMGEGKGGRWGRKGWGDWEEVGKEGGREGELEGGRGGEVVREAGRDEGGWREGKEGEGWGLEGGWKGEVRREGGREKKEGWRAKGRRGGRDQGEREEGLEGRREKTKQGDSGGQQAGRQGPGCGQGSGLGVAEAAHEERDGAGIVPEDEEEGAQGIQQQDRARHRGGHGARRLHAGLVQHQHRPVPRCVHCHRWALRQPAQLRVQEQPVVCGIHSQHQPHGDTEGCMGETGGLR